MTTISTEDPVAVAAVTAIQQGDLEALRRLLAESPWLATARLGDDDPGGMSRRCCTSRPTGRRTFLGRRTPSPHWLRPEPT